MPTAPPVHRSPGWTPKLAWTKAPGTDQRTLVGRPWRRLRDRIMARDKYLCQRCLEAGIYTIAVECDHILPLAQGGTDEAINLQALCHGCHGIKTAVEGHGHEGRASAHPEWLPIPACAVVLVTGPPGGGKTTYCKAKATHRDVVIDLDECFKDVCGVHGHEADTRHLPSALRWRNKQLADLASKRQGMAYVIVSSPTQAECEWWMTKLKASHHLCDPTEAVCLERIQGKRKEIAHQWYRLRDDNVWVRHGGRPPA